MRGHIVRRQVLVVAAAALVLAVGAVLWYVFSQSHVSGIVADGARTNVLLIVHDEAAITEGMALLSITYDDLALFAIPVDLLLKGPAPGGDLVATQEAYARFGGASTAEMAGDLLGVEIPYYVAIDRETLQGWIDTMGETAIDVSETAIYIDQSVDPPLRVEIRAGTQRMNGADAAAFATSPAEPGGSRRSDRFLAFLSAVLQSGITAPSQREVNASLRDLHPALDTNCESGDVLELANVLRGVSEDRMQAAVVPTQTDVVEGGEWVQPLIVETERLVAAAVKGLDLLTPEDVTIAVFNGNGIRQMASQTAAYLRARGFIVSRIANADSFDYPTSYIIVLSTEAKAWVLSDALISDVQIVFPGTFADHYEALEDFIPAGTDLVFIAGDGMELE